MYTFIQNDAIVSIYAETKVSNGSRIIIIIFLPCKSHSIHKLVCPLLQYSNATQNYVCEELRNHFLGDIPLDRNQLDRLPVDGRTKIFGQKAMAKDIEK